MNKQSLRITISFRPRVGYPVNTFEPGTTICGLVTLTVQERFFRLQSLHALVQGSSCISAVNDEVNSDVVYLNHYVELLTSTSPDLSTLARGQHIFPFDCILPRGLPSSVATNGASVKYMVKAIVTRAEGSMEPLIQIEPFYIRALINYADVPTFKETWTHREVFGKTPAKVTNNYASTKSVIAHSRIDRRAFFYGEYVSFELAVSNGMRRLNVVGIHAELDVYYRYRPSTRPSLEEAYVLDSIEKDCSISYGEAKEWYDLRLNIPSHTPATTLESHSSIDVKYALVFKIRMNSGQLFMFHTPVVIGVNIPFHLRRLISPSSAEHDGKDDEVKLTRRKPKSSAKYVQQQTRQKPAVEIKLEEKEAIIDFFQYSDDDEEVEVEITNNYIDSDVRDGDTHTESRLHFAGTNLEAGLY